MSAAAAVCHPATHLSCPQKTGSAVLGLTTGGRCCHYTPHGRSGLPSRPLSQSYSAPEGTGRWRLQHDTEEREACEERRIHQEEEGAEDIGIQSETRLI